MSLTPAVQKDLPFPIELQIWLSPSFPVGSFAYSHGLEWAASTGRVRDRASTDAWLGDLISHGTLRNDAILLARTWRAVVARDAQALRDINALAIALAGSRERHLETTTQGNAFMTTVLATWGNDDLTQMRAALDGDIAYPIAIGCVAATWNVAITAVLTAYLGGMIQNLVSALVRLAVIGQTEGQRVIAALVPAIAATVSMAEQSTLDDLGGAAFMSDIAAIGHETQETRLFRS